MEKLLKKLLKTLDKELKEDYCYTGNFYKRENKQQFMKDKIAKKFNLTPEYVASKTEWELMQELDYDRLWDAGKVRWSMKV